MKKRNKVSEIIKNIVFVTIMALSFCEFAQEDKANAATADTIIYEEKEISQYRESGEEYIAPRKEGYIFGGWYKEQNENVPLSDKVTSGKAYAKFVPEDVLTVLCQNSQGTDSDTDMTNVRLVTSTDSDLYQKIGFDIEIYGTKTTKYNYETSTVYKSIKIANGKDIISVSASRDFSKESKYFVTVKMINIPNAGFNTAYLVRPYWITLDGTKVYGLDRYARVRNGYDGSFSVPVRINAPEKQVAVSLLDIGYDNSELEFEGYDCGNIFDEYTSREDNGNIKILGNVKAMDKNVPADGMLVSLNFKVKNYDIIEETYSFDLNKADFCNLNESRINVGNIVLKSVKK